MENYESTLREMLRAISVSSSLSLGPFEQNWTDEDFLNKLKDTRWYLIDELSASKNVAHNMLRFLLTGKTRTGLVQDIMHQFICAMEWFDDGFGSSCHVVKDLMVHLGSTPHVFSTPTSLSKKDLVNEFKNRLDFPHTETSTSNANSKLGLSIHGLINIHYDEAVKMVEQYYDLIEIYYSLNKRHQPMSGEIKRSISFVRSLYVLVLILLRCRAKDQDTVMGYIRNGSYMRIARRLVNSPGDVLFSINPKSAELSSFLLFLSSSTGLESTYYVLLGIYCGLREGISKPHIVNFDGEIPQKIINPLQVSNTHRYSSLTELLKSGCMMHIKYKGMYPIRNIEELSHLSSKSITDILKILCTTDTVGHCQRIGRIYEKYNPRWSKCEGVIYYHPAETTWKYSKIFSDFVLPELSSKNNVQLIYRLVSILASHKKIEMPTIMCLKGYIVKENDIEYIQNISRKLFPHS